MEILKDLADYVEQGKSKEAGTLTQKLLGENISADTIITEGVMAGLDALGKNLKSLKLLSPN